MLAVLSNFNFFWHFIMPVGLSFYNCLSVLPKTKMKNAILICCSKVITRPVLPLAGALIVTIMPQLWIFSKHVILMLF